MEDNREKVSEAEILDAIIEAGRDNKMPLETIDEAPKKTDFQIVAERLRGASSMAEKEQILQEYGMAERRDRVFDRPIKTITKAQTTEIDLSSLRPANENPNRGGEKMQTWDAKSEEKNRDAIDRAIEKGAVLEGNTGQLHF